MLLGRDLGSGESGKLGQDGGYLVRRGELLLSGRQPAVGEAGRAGLLVSGGPGQLGSREHGGQADYLMVREHLQRRGEDGRQQLVERQPGQLARGGAGT